MSDRKHEETMDLRAAYVKWSIFGVLLPLLPFAARFLAAWIDGAPSSSSFISLFGDGELLVVATVIAAAVIGDILFDFTGRGVTRGRTREAMTCAVALVVVVASVLMFGLATLENQNRTDAAVQAQREGATRAVAASQLFAEANQDQNLAASLSSQASHLNSEIASDNSKANQEAFGTGGSGVPGEGPLYDLLKHQAALSESQAADASARASTLYHEAAAARDEANRLVLTTSSSVTNGERQTAIMSVVMFLFSCAVGALALLVPAIRQNQPELRPQPSLPLTANASLQIPEQQVSSGSVSRTSEHSDSTADESK